MAHPDSLTSLLKHLESQAENAKGVLLRACKETSDPKIARAMGVYDGMMNALLECNRAIALSDEE